MYTKVTSNIRHPRYVLNPVLYIISYYETIPVAVLYTYKNKIDRVLYIKHDSAENRCINYTRYVSVELIKAVRLPLRGIK